ncbi:MAG: 4,5-DOPA-extradiol-dioxygenase [Vulcanimicrobiaceae bacterium]
MPVCFLGHGNPMNALAENVYTQAWRRVAAELPDRPRAVLCIIAHWYEPMLAVTAMSMPRTIHDFGGFPRELYAMTYPAPGSPDWAQRVADLLSPSHVVLDTTWGLDHGTWAVLCHVFPDATIPIVQLSLDARLPFDEHYELAARLQPLRDEGIFIVGSGNIVHNLEAARWGTNDASAYPWAAEFDAFVRDALLDRKHDRLTHLSGEAAMLSVPTPEHYLPLLTCAALARDTDRISFPCEGIDLASISMRSVLYSPKRS